MRHERNVEGLRQNAQKKRQEAVERTEQGIKTLLKEGRTVNFKTVAEAAGVSTAWLYKEPQIKERIEHLRQQQVERKSLPLKQKATYASKDAMIKTLKERVKKQELEIRGLRDHIEVVQGIAMQVKDLNKQISALISENLLLKEQRDLCIDSRTNHGEAERVSKVFPLRSRNAGRPSISYEIQSELDSLGIQLNSTLEKKIKSAPVDVVMKVIESLKQAQAKGDVQNPPGFLVEGIKGQWTPNMKADPTSIFPSGFLEAYQRLCDAGMVDGGDPSTLPIWGNEIYVRVVNLNPKPWEAPYIQMHWKEALVQAGLA